MTDVPSTLGAQVLGVGLWTPGFASASAWVEGRADPASTERPKATLLDRACARRASPFAKTLALAYGEAADQAGVALDEVAAVFGSALGETSVMLELLAQMISGRDEDFSPMRFAVSVHNAASGLVSISTKNRAFTTSVAADHDTPAMALLEGMGSGHAFGTPAVVACGDEAAPSGLVREDEAFAHLAVALALAPLDHPGPALARIDAMTREAAGTLEPPRVDPALALNPQVGMLDLADALLRGRRGRVRLDRGRGRGWTVAIGDPK